MMSNSVNSSLHIIYHLYSLPHYSHSPYSEYSNYSHLPTPLPTSSYTHSQIHDMVCIYLLISLSLMIGSSLFSISMNSVKSSFYHSLRTNAYAAKMNLISNMNSSNLLRYILNYFFFILLLKTEKFTKFSNWNIFCISRGLYII